MQTNWANAPRHERSKYCQEMAKKRRQHKAAETAAQAQAETFTAYSVELEMVEVFKYLGRFIRHDDNDDQAVRSNLGKARGG